MNMVKSFDHVVEKVRMLPAEQQETAACILEEFLSEVGSLEPLADRPMGFMADAFEITGEIVDTGALW